MFMRLACRSLTRFQTLNSVSFLSYSSPRPQNSAQSHQPHQPASSPVLSVPSSYNQTFADNLARFENLISPWSAGRSQRPLTSKSEKNTLSHPPAAPGRSSDFDANVSKSMRVAAAGALDVPLWKFEQQGAAAITDAAFRLNHGKVLKSPRSKRNVLLQDGGFMPLPLQSSNTQGACCQRASAPVDCLCSHHAPQAQA
jgi:hypothetical protein